MELEVRTKNVYGNELIYPVNETAIKFTILLGCKTLNYNQLFHIKVLGYTIKYVI